MMPDKVYLEEECSVSVVGFVSPAWNNPRDKKNTVEYIRKEALLEWAKEQKKWRIECDYEGTRYVSAIHALNHLIDKLNSM